MSSAVSVVDWLAHRATLVDVHPHEQALAERGELDRCDEIGDFGDDERECPECHRSMNMDPAVIVVEMWDRMSGYEDRKTSIVLCSLPCVAQWSIRWENRVLEIIEAEHGEVMPRYTSPDEHWLMTPANT